MIKIIALKWSMKLIENMQVRNLIEWKQRYAYTTVSALELIPTKLYMTENGLNL